MKIGIEGRLIFEVLAVKGALEPTHRVNHRRIALQFPAFAQAIVKHRGNETILGVNCCFRLDHGSKRRRLIQGHSRQRQLLLHLRRPLRLEHVDHLGDNLFGVGVGIK